MNLAAARLLNSRHHPCHEQRAITTAGGHDRARRNGNGAPCRADSNYAVTSAESSTSARKFHNWTNRL